MNKQYILSVFCLFSVYGAINATTKSTVITFNFKNSSSLVIDDYSIKQRGKIIREGGMLGKNKEISLAIDTSWATELTFNYTDSKRIAKKATVLFPSGTTLFVKFTGTTVEPQKGTRGKSTHGYDLGNNIKKVYPVIKTVQ